MNYIWDLIIRAEQSGIPRQELHFVKAASFSPYMELSLSVLNTDKVEHQVEINPYYRFNTLFSDLFDVNMEEDHELRHALFDILVHFLAELDLMQGMNQREFYIRFLIRDMHSGCFGQSVQEKIALFDRQEQDIIACHLLQLYETNEFIYYFTRTIREMFRGAMIGCKQNKDELLVYLGVEATPELRMKLQLIKELFLPIWFEVDLFWHDYVGIIDVDSSMRLDEVALY